MNIDTMMALQLIVDDTSLRNIFLNAIKNKVYIGNLVPIARLQQYEIDINKVIWMDITNKLKTMFLNNERYILQISAADVTFNFNAEKIVTGKNVCTIFYAEKIFKEVAKISFRKKQEKLDMIGD